MLWTRPPSGAPRVRRVPGPMPARVSAVRAQRLFIAKDGVPSPLLNQIDWPGLRPEVFMNNSG
jgi:hypothetical protein